MAVCDAPAGAYEFYGHVRFEDGHRWGSRSGEDERLARNYPGNTHGGMLILNGNEYIFYHRQTNQHSYSRQACAEKLTRRPDGGFLQAEVTSCVLNDVPLRGVGEYEARFACNL